MTREAFITRFVDHILEELFVHFSGETVKGIEKLPSPDAASRARSYLEEIRRRRSGEGAP